VDGVLNNYLLQISFQTSRIEKKGHPHAGIQKAVQSDAHYGHGYAWNPTTIAGGKPTKDGKPADILAGC
jgi:hypothetical protein